MNDCSCLNTAGDDERSLTGEDMVRVPRFALLLTEFEAAPPVNHDSTFTTPITSAPASKLPMFEVVVAVETIVKKPFEASIPAVGITFPKIFKELARLMVLPAELKVKFLRAFDVLGTVELNFRVVLKVPLIIRLLTLLPITVPWVTINEGSAVPKVKVNPSNSMVAFPCKSKLLEVKLTSSFGKFPLLTCGMITFSPLNGARQTQFALLLHKLLPPNPVHTIPEKTDNTDELLDAGTIPQLTGLAVVALLIFVTSNVCPLSETFTGIVKLPAPAAFAVMPVTLTSVPAPIR